MIRSTFALIRAQLIEIRRSKTALFWMTAFPLGFLLLFGFVMARGDARVAAFMMPGLLTTTLMSGSLFGVALPLVQQRETGLLRRLRVTPVPAAAVAIAHGVTAILTGLISLVVLMTLGAAALRRADGRVVADADRGLSVRRLRARADGPAGRQHRARHPHRARDRQPAVLPDDVPVGIGDAVRRPAGRRAALRAAAADDVSQRDLLAA